MSAGSGEPSGGERSPRERARDAVALLVTPALLPAITLGLGLALGGACTGNAFLGGAPEDAGPDQSAGTGASGGNTGGSGGSGTGADGGSGGSGGSDQPGCEDGAGDGGPCEKPIDPGAFSPAVQCTWPEPGVPVTPYPSSLNVLTTPLVGDLPNDSGAAAEIVIATFDGTGKEDEPGKFGVLRILNGQTCALLETIDLVQLRAAATPALADLDNDGTLEIIARRNTNGIVAFKWTGGRYNVFWEADGRDVSQGQPWDGPSVHDLDDDGRPEVLLEAQVYNGRTGAEIAPPTPFVFTTVFNGLIPVVGDLDANGIPELVTPQQDTSIALSEWRDSAWVPPRFDTIFGRRHSHFAYADFGTAGASAQDFDPKKLDGIAEIVAVNAELGGGWVSIYTISGQVILDVFTEPDPDVQPPPLNEGGGPPNIGDFDGDGMPEAAVAGATRLRVFDLDCADSGSSCEDPSKYVRWSQPSQDGTSRQTGASIFDFDGDKKAELVYADECFLRIYKGATGEVIYSAYRTSGTWYESPVVADVDRDQNTEIIVNSNIQSVACPTGSPDGTPYIDPLHTGVGCEQDEDCVSGRCDNLYCRCDADVDCGASDALVCADPPSGTPGTGKTCRSQHPNSSNKHPGIRVLRDRLDRWTSSRPVWNQHAYSITNINDDGSIPKTSEWVQNFKAAGLNNYRQNSQGTIPGEQLPDIVGRLSGPSTCQRDDASNTVVLYGCVCNQGRKGVGAALPGTFYKGEIVDHDILCVSYTDGPVLKGECKRVRCELNRSAIGKVSMVVNDDGATPGVEECKSDNNETAVIVEKCPPIECGGAVEFPCPGRLVCVDGICVPP